jgi:hypothetical protein
VATAGRSPISLNRAYTNHCIPGDGNFRNNLHDSNPIRRLVPTYGASRRSNSQYRCGHHFRDCKDTGRTHSTPAQRRDHQSFMSEPTAARRPPKETFDSICKFGNFLRIRGGSLQSTPVVELVGPGRLMRSPARSSHGIDSRSFLASSRLQTGVLPGLESVKDAAGNH